ncbi:MAG: hypothetical protein ACI8VC_000868 [Candidatus Endobugula sp.]|jgi:uncharacterized protein YheU (UPF0270 family)
MIIPIEHINNDTLESLIESFITREGTDYGVNEISLGEKVYQVKKQLSSRDIVIVFDAASESVNIMTKAQYEQWCISS